MFASESIQRAIKLTTRRMSTDYLIKKAVILSTHQALSEVFGSNYSTRCLQSSVTINHLLSKLNITSEVHVGVACFGRALADESSLVGWTGFWGTDRHTWVVTNNKEIVDLTVSQLHIHPKSTTNDEPIPIIWYRPYDKLPVVINYKPYGPAKWEFSKIEENEIEECKRVAAIRLDSLISKSEILDELPAPILTGPNSLQRLHDSGNRWLNKCIAIQRMNMQLPSNYI